MTTLYTDIPIYFESFSAGIETCRVSQAKNIPKAFSREQTFIFVSITRDNPQNRDRKDRKKRRNETNEKKKTKTKKLEISGKKRKCH